MLSGGQLLPNAFVWPINIANIKTYTTTKDEEKPNDFKERTAVTYKLKEKKGKS